MFAADGSLDRVYYEGGVTRPVTPICLLVGNRENVNDADPAKLNLQNYNSLWVAIDARTGLIVTTELAAAGDQTAVYQSRAYARKWDAMGGK